MLAMVAAAVLLFYAAAIPVHITFRLQTDADVPFRFGISLFEPCRSFKPVQRREKRFRLPGKLHPADAFLSVKTALKRLRIERIILNGSFGSGDAAATALICGSISAIGCMICKYAALRLTPDFSADRLRVDLTGMISLRAGHIMTAALFGAIQYGSRRFKAWTGIPLKAS